MNYRTLTLAASLAALLPIHAHACACGCGIFSVATSSMLPESSGGIFYMNYSYQDQDQNWSGASSAQRANNGDKRVETTYYTLGSQYMFSRAWGISAELPFVDRQFNSTDEDSGDPVSSHVSSIGDLRLKGIYTGFSEDMSTGLTFGLKLPTGRIHDNEAIMDRDTQIGSGSTDLLLGGFHRQHLSTAWDWFNQAEIDVPVFHAGGYNPGVETNFSTGVYYNGFQLGGASVVPIAQFIGSWRTHDNGSNAEADDTGYQRYFFSPGVEVDFKTTKVYADVELPIFQNVRGNQLVSSYLYKLGMSYAF
jgi:hypothetical protein